jgi:hypothetical protein
MPSTSAAHHIGRLGLDGDKEILFVTTLRDTVRTRKHMTEHRLGNSNASRRSTAMLANGALNSYRDLKAGRLKIRRFG